MLREERALPPFAVLSDPAFLERVAQSHGWDVPLIAVEPAQIPDTFPKALPVLPLSVSVSAQPGRPDAGAAASVVESIETAVRLVREGSASALVTNPIAKHVLYEAGFRHPGH